MGEATLVSMTVPDILLFCTYVTQRWGSSHSLLKKPIKRSGWWKGKFATFWMPATGVGKTTVQKLTASNRQSVGNRFYRQREGATCKNSIVSSDSHVELVFSGLPSVVLVVLGTVNLQFHSQFPFLWGQFLELWQFMSWVQSTHHVVNFIHLVEVSVSTNQLTGYDSEYFS